MASRTIAAYTVGRTSRQDSIRSGAVSVTVSSDPTVLQGLTPGGSAGGSQRDTTATAPTLAAYGQGRIIVLRWDRQTNLTSLAGYELQVSDDGITWYQLDSSGTAWRGAAGATTVSYAEVYEHVAVPLGGTVDRPTTVTLRYRVRRVTRAGPAPGAPATTTEGRGPWSAVVQTTAGAVTAGELAADIVSAAKVDPQAFLRGVDEGLLVCWSMDEGIVSAGVRAGARYTDSSGHHRHGRVTGTQRVAQASATSPAAVSGRAARFESSDALDIQASGSRTDVAGAAPLPWEGGEWTISAWLRVSAPVGRGAARWLDYDSPLDLHQDQPANSEKFNQLNLQINSRGKLRITGGTHLTGAAPRVVGSHVTALTVVRGPPDWVHVCVVRSGRTLQAWIDGVSQEWETSAATTAPLVASGLEAVSVTAGGSGYTSAPTVTFTGGGGSGATATATLSGNAVSDVTVTDPGSGYTSAPTVTFTGGGGSGATATAAIASAHLRIGAPLGFVADNRFDGDLDEVRIYDRALSEGEIKFLLLVPGGPTPSMVISDRIIAGSITAEHLAVETLRAVAARVGTLEVGPLEEASPGRIDLWGVGGAGSTLRSYLTADEMAIQRRSRSTEQWSDAHSYAHLLTQWASGEAGLTVGVAGGAAAVYSPDRRRRLLLTGGGLLYQVRSGSTWAIRGSLIPSSDTDLDASIADLAASGNATVGGTLGVTGALTALTLTLSGRQAPVIPGVTMTATNYREAYSAIASCVRPGQEAALTGAQFMLRGSPPGDSNWPRLLIFYRCRKNGNATARIYSIVYDLTLGAFGGSDIERESDGSIRIDGRASGERNHIDVSPTSSTGGKMFMTISPITTAGSLS